LIPDPTHHPPTRARRTILELIALTLLCAFTYGFGPTHHGLTNWQEAQRALVAREMFDRGDWIVPHANARPYLAKPPLIYWCQLGLAIATVMRRELGPP
jgi:4-amino-4-deoxy-L-arabinose transferase-like glycosyltransferase